MKITIAKVAAAIGALPVIVGVIWGYAALAGDVNKNSIHTLQANVDRWTYLYLQYEQNNPQPRAPSTQAQIERWKQQVNLALAEINSRQEKN